MKRITRTDKEKPRAQMKSRAETIQEKAGDYILRYSVTESRKVSEFRLRNSGS